jgi:O-antigen ligase
VRGHTKVLVALSLLATLATIIHWQFVLANLSAFGIPLALLPVALLVHGGIAVGLGALIVKRHRKDAGRDQ